MDGIHRAASRTPNIRTSEGAGLQAVALVHGSIHFIVRADVQQQCLLVPFDEQEQHAAVLVHTERLRACLGSIERRSPRLFYDQTQPEDHRVAVLTGSFSGEVWAEKRPGDEFEEIPNRL